jgi:hypothetical protein
MVNSTDGTKITARAGQTNFVALMKGLQGTDHLENLCIGGGYY